MEYDESDLGSWEDQEQEAMRRRGGSEVVAFTPGMMPAGQCRGVKKTGARCRNYAVGGTGVCVWHGANRRVTQELAGRRMEQVRAELFDVLVDAARDACEVYTGVMRYGKRDADRLKAADRVLQLLGLAPRDPVVQVSVESGTGGEDIDARLKELLLKVANERANEGQTGTGGGMLGEGSGSGGVIDVDVNDEGRT